MKDKKSKIEQRLTWSARFRYAVSDLRHRLGTISRPILAIAIGTGIFLVLTFYGFEFFRYQRDLVSAETLTHITAMCEDISDRDARFTKDRLTELGGRDDIAIAYPKIEQGISLSANIAGQMHISAEGIELADPRIDVEKLEWTAPETITDGSWIIVSRQVFYKLGGIIRDGVPSPTALMLKVARRKGGQEEQLELPVAIKGILKRQKTDRVYIPQQLAQRLDKYTSHKINVLGDSDESAPADYEYAYAYVRPEYESRIEEDAKYLNIQMSDAGSVEVLVPDSLPVWGVIEGAKDDAVLESLTSVVPGLQRYPEYTVVLRTLSGNLTVVALSDDDPRWNMVPRGMPARGHLITKNADYCGLSLTKRPFGIEVETVCETLPVVGDLICSHDTLAWLHFDPATADAIDREILLVTDSTAMARALAASKLEVRCERPAAWRIFKIKPQPAEGPAPVQTASTPASDDTGLMTINQPSVSISGTSLVAEQVSETVGILRDAAPAHAGVIESGVLTLEYGDRNRGTAILQAYIIPDGLFRCMTEDGSRDVPNGRIPCLVSGRLPSDVYGSKLTVGEKQVDIYSASELEEDASLALWVPKSAVEGLIESRSEHAVAVWGSWSQVWDAEQRLETAGRIGQTLLQGDPSQFWCVAANTNHKLVDRFMAAGPGSRYAKLWVSSVGSRRIVSVVEQKGLSGTLVEELLSKDRRLTWMDQQAFCAEVFEANGGKYLEKALRFPRCAVSVPTTMGYQVLSRWVTNQGHPFREITPVRKEAWARYRITDRSADDGRVTDNLLRVVEMTKPTFAEVEPFLSVSGAFGSSEISLIGTTGSDPFQFDAKIRQGRWISDGTSPEIVLPYSQESAFGMTNLMGRFVQVKFQREDPVTHRTEDLAMALQVVGLTDVSTGYIPAGLARNLGRWTRNECVFNSIKGTFETPIEMYERRGFIRANIVAASAESVEPLVRWLESQRYRTESGLGEIAGLQQLGKSLFIIVVFFSIGALLNAAISVWSTTAMNVDSKSWEIGLLKALSVGDSEILTIFLIQGMIIGVIGFIGAIGLAAFAEPLFLRAGLASVFGNGITDVIHGGILNFRNWVLIAAAFGVSLGFSLVGMAVPALKACRMIPVEALSRKE